MSPTFLIPSLSIFPHLPSEPGTLQLQISSLDYSSYVGRIAVGRVSRGSIQAGMQVSLVKNDGTILKSIVKELYLFEGLSKEKVKFEVEAGEICAVLGPENFDIGDTLADPENPGGDETDQRG
jgi:GTP-binding protein